MDNMELVIHNFFNEYAGLEGLSNAAIVVCRQDGVPLFSVQDFSEDWNESTIGALVGGVWQASETLTQFLPQVDDEDFRFSFETSSCGVFIVKTCGDFEPIYLSFIYFDLLNPGKIKARIKSLISKLSFYIEENLEFENTTDDVFLFNDISDSEMDNLFSEAIKH